MQLDALDQIAAKGMRDTSFARTLLANSKDSIRYPRMWLISLLGRLLCQR